MNVLDEIRENAALRPDHPALVLGGAPGESHAIGYAELVRRFERIAEELRATGVRPFDRCGLVAKQGAGFVEGALGILAADLCLVPIPDGTTGAALEAAVAEAHLHHLVEEAGGFTCSHAARVEPVEGAGDEAFRALAPAYLRFTSGTTHLRKGVIIGHDAILDRLANANEGLSIGPEDRILWLLPMAHHFVVSILLYLRYGATILLPPSSLARPVLELAAGQGATVFYASPYHYQLLAKDGSGLGLDRVRLAVSTADGLRADVATGFAERFGHPLVQALGIIEVGLPVLNFASAREKPEALGRPLPGYEVWLRGEDGAPVAGTGAPERTGEICIRGSGCFDAYLAPWTPASEILSPDGFRTGDQAWLDADGDLHLAGRRSNRINLAGMKFFSEEVEAVLDAHPGIECSRVSGRPHAHLGEIPVAEIVVRDGVNPPKRGDLLAYCREQLPTYKIPRQIEVVDALPLTPTGKLRRWQPTDSGAPE